MRKRNKLNLEKIIAFLLESEFVRGFLLTLAFSTLIIARILTTSEISVDIFLDFKMVNSIIFVFLVNAIVRFMVKFVKNRFEDSIKLAEDYSYLNKLYSANVNGIKYTNLNGESIKIPISVEFEASNEGINIIFADRKSMFELPPFAEKHLSELIHTHDASKIYNQLMIRVDDYRVVDNAVTFQTSRTTYFNSLITNRACDYKLGGVSIRDLYGYGPFVIPLNESLLSNHLGFNGFVETADSKIAFILRHKSVSIGKNTIQCSVGAALKTKYSLNNEELMTNEGLKNSIVSEINDELKIDKSLIEFSCEKNIIAFYRDLIECGKPQLLFYVKLEKLNSGELLRCFRQDLKQNKSSKSKFVATNIDGYKLILVDKKDLIKIHIGLGYIIINGKRYKSMPSHGASLAILIGFLKRQGMLE